MDTLGSQRATYDDIIALPDHVTGQIIDGQLYTQPRPAGPHGIVATALGARLETHFGGPGPGGWVFIHEPELHLGDDILVPDLAGWRAPRLPFEARQQPSFDIAPDWVGEILSPTTAHRDRAIKAPAYARHHVGHLWFIDPVAGNIDAYARTSQPNQADPAWLWLGNWAQDDARIAPFDQLALDLATIWARVRGPEAGHE